MKQKQMYYIIGIVALIVAIYFAWKKYGSGQGKVQFLPQFTGGGSQLIMPDENLILGNGSSGKEVEELQKRLNTDFSAGLEVDGIFGPLTEAALVDNLGVYQISLTEYEIFFDQTPTNTIPAVSTGPTRS